MVAQVEHPRETDRGVPRLVPIAVAVLAGDQIGDATRDCRVADLAGRHQGKQSPGGLRCGAVRRLAMRHTRPIAVARFAPAAIGALMGEQPSNGAADLRRRRIDADRIQRGQHRPSAVDVVGSPAAEPTAVRLLLAP